MSKAKSMNFETLSKSVEVGHGGKTKYLEKALNEANAIHREVLTFRHEVETLTDLLILEDY